MNRNQKLKANLITGLFLALVFLVLVYVFNSGGTIDERQNQEFRLAQVNRVIDGDTIQLKSGEKVRYIGINTPEKGDPYSEIATERNQEMVEDKLVKLEYGTEKLDKYNRLLAYVYVDDLFVNLQLVKEGLAWDYPVEPNLDHQLEFEMAEADAKQDRIGLWSRLTTMVYKIKNMLCLNYSNGWL